MIGKNIRKRRLELGLTQEELAHKLGYKHKSTINKIELDINDVSQSKLLKLAAALECDPITLLDIQPTQTYPTAAVQLYAEKLATLPPAVRGNALQYIDYLIKTTEEMQELPQG